MNLKEYALRYQKPELVWTDGQLLKMNNGVSDSSLIDLSLAIIINNHLKNRILSKEKSPTPEKWDARIEESRAELDKILEKLEGVR